MTRRVRLTDQALVAVVAARQVAEATHSGPATVVDLLVGLAAEPDGLAGGALRERATAAVTLAERAPAAAAWAPPIEVALAWAADAAEPRPPGTLDLLAAGVEVGGGNLADLLEACGLDGLLFTDREVPPSVAPEGWYRLRPVDPGEDLYRRLVRRWGEHGSERSETVGMPHPATVPLDTEAALAVGQVRALAGGAVDLVLAAALIAGDDLGYLLSGVDALWTVVWELDRRGVPERAGADWDRGLEAVLDAAATFRPGATLTAEDLLLAAAVAGGEGPRLLLDAARPTEDAP